MMQVHESLFLEAVKYFPYEIIENGKLNNHAHSISQQYRLQQRYPIFGIQCGGIITLTFDSQNNPSVTCNFYLVMYARKFQPSIVGKFDPTNKQWTLGIDDQQDSEEGA